MRYLIRISYNGKNYSGFQIQKDADTIQARLENAMSIALKSEINLVSSGRTDAGVSAIVQVCHFDVEESIDIDNLNLDLLKKNKIKVNLDDLFRSSSQKGYRNEAYQRGKDKIFFNIYFNGIEAALNDPKFVAAIWNEKDFNFTEEMIVNYEDKETGNIKQIDDTMWEIEGNVLIDEINQAFETKFSVDDHDTFSGLVFGHYGTIPPDNTKFETEIENLCISVVKILDHKIEKAIIKKKCEAN